MTSEQALPEQLTAARLRRPHFFRRFAHRTSNAVGTPTAFGLALGVVVVWAATGPLFHFSDTWQLAINTSTTIVTFLMVFVIQFAQNRETDAIRLKLDELITAIDAARHSMIAVDDLEDDELRALHDEFQRLAATKRTLRAAEPQTEKDRVS